MIVLLIFIIILFYLLTLKPQVYEQFMIPLESPFNSKFFQKKPLKIKVGATGNPYESKFFRLFFKSDEQTKVLGKRYPSYLDMLQAVQDRKLDFAIVNGPSVRHLKNSRIRLVGKIFTGSINILAANDLGIQNLSEITQRSRHLQRKIVINVGSKNSQHHISCLQILKELRLSKYATLNYDDNQTSIGNNFEGCKLDLVYRIGQHPDKLFKELTQRVRAHLIGIKRLNNGDIFEVIRRERKFFNNNPGYRKGLLDLDLLIPGVYPYLSLLNRNQLNVATLDLDYVLVTHDQVDPQKIRHVLPKIIEYIRLPQLKKPVFIRDLKFSELRFSKIPIPVDETANQVFLESF